VIVDGEVVLMSLRCRNWAGAGRVCGHCGDRAPGALRHQCRGLARHDRAQARDCAGDRVDGSRGWSAPQLVATFAGKPLDDILDLQFIATMPSQSQKAEGFVQLGAVFALEEGHPFKGVRVRASENAVEVKQIPGSSQANITVSGSKDCIGKKFAERGQAQPRQPGVVRQEDLPKVLRWIIPSRGIRGITHNPNRLNLILSDDNTIVEAFWE
jgi:hypothetical protein